VLFAERERTGHQAPSVVTDICQHSLTFT
jgi:hypothetical protein